MVIDILYTNRSPRIYKDYSPTIRSERIGLLVINENIQMSKISENRVCKENSEGLRST